MTWRDKLRGGVLMQISKETTGELERELRQMAVAFEILNPELSIVRSPERIIRCEGKTVQGVSFSYERYVDAQIDPSDERGKYDPLGAHFEVFDEESSDEGAIFFVNLNYRWTTYGVPEPGLVWTMVRGLYCLNHPAFALLEGQGYGLSAHERLELALGYKERLAVGADAKVRQIRGTSTLALNCGAER